MKRLLLTAGLLLTIGSAGCEVSMDQDGKLQVVHTDINLTANSEIQGSSVEPAPVEISDDPVVCDPLGGSGGNGQASSGIRGELYYFSEALRTSLPNPFSTPVDFLIQNGIRIGATVYMNDLNVPTRPFDRGFETQEGNFVKTPTGENLYEYFGLKLETQIKLSQVDQAGYYQFGIVSDDGVIVDLDTDGHGLATAISDPFVHPPKFACGSNAVYLDGSTRIPARVQYFQGPRYHIALQLMWRQVPESEIQNPAFYNDEACGRFGTGEFHDSSHNPPLPMPTYIGMQQRGWKPLNSNNYTRPAHDPGNPCSNGGSSTGTVGTHGGETCTGIGCGSGGIGV